MKKLKKFLELLGTILMAALVVAVIIALFLSEMALYDECMADGHSALYCMRILSR